MNRVNCNVDLIVRGTSLLKALNQEPTPGVNHDVIHSVNQLQESFAYSFSMGAAAERFFSTKEPYATVVEAASQLKDAHVSFLKIWGNLPPFLSHLSSRELFLQLRILIKDFVIAVVHWWERSIDGSGNG